LLLAHEFSINIPLHMIKCHCLNLKIPVSLVFIAALFSLPSSTIAQQTKTTMSERINNADSVKGITIHQEVNFSVGPQRLYETLLSSKQFSDCTKKSFGNFTARSAKIDSTVGGAFSLFDGHIIGRILELVPNQRIVEAWRVVDWPGGAYSIAKFEFIPQGSGTKLVFDHVGFPEGLKEHLSIGWTQHYWEALSKYFQ
jgi:activator of HSP90 ATPase